MENHVPPLDSMSTGPDTVPDTGMAGRNTGGGGAAARLDRNGREAGSDAAPVVHDDIEQEHEVKRANTR